MKSNRPYVGHYGCSDRLVRVLPVRGRRMPHFNSSFKVACPACGLTHIVKPIWRQAKRGERATAELQLLAEQRVGA